MMTTRSFEDAGPTPAHAASGSQGKGATATRVLSRGQGLSRGKKTTRPEAHAADEARGSRREQKYSLRKNCVARGSRS